MATRERTVVSIKHVVVRVLRRMPPVWVTERAVQTLGFVVMDLAREDFEGLHRFRLPLGTVIDDDHLGRATLSEQMLSSRTTRRPEICVSTIAASGA